MEDELMKICADHPCRSDCPDALIEYRSKTGEFGLLVHDGGSSMILIEYCPWCGSSLKAV